MKQIGRVAVKEYPALDDCKGVADYQVPHFRGVPRRNTTMESN
jgi:hypothetical protein